MFNWNSLYNINWFVLINQLTPPTRRLPKWLAWLTVITSKVRQLHADFITYRTDTNYLLSVNSQRMVLERLLNRVYMTEPTDYTTSQLIADGFIYIANTPSAELLEYVYTEEEENPVYINTEAEGDPVFYYTESEINGGFKFIVNVPAALYATVDLPSMHAYIDRYNLCDKPYKIQSY